MTAGGNQTVSTLCASYGTKWNGNAGAYNGDQFVAEPVAAFMAGQAKNSRSIAYNETLSPTLKGSPSGLNQVPCVCEPKIARTLMARHDSSPCADRGQNIVAFAQDQRNELRDLNDLAGCLAAEPGMKQQTYIVHPDIAGTLLGSGAGMSRAAGNCGETDLAVAYPTFCLQGNMLGRADKNGPQGSGVNTEISFTLDTNDKHAIAAVDCRNLVENDELSGTLQSKSGYVIRRLTPTECERLMSFDDGYTETGHDGKIMSDSARYSMLGNSIVVNVLAYIMQNIAEQLGKENHN
jgi:DNA (cytosine-5)-methyltransferase 1